MRTGTKLFTRGTVGLLATLIIVDITLLAYVRIKRYYKGRPEAVFRDTSDPDVAHPPTGYSIAGQRISFSVPANRGWVVRYATKSCEFCRADEARWSALKFQLAAEGYQIYELPPTLRGAYPDRAHEMASEVQIPFVDVGWIKNRRFIGTPTTVLFDPHGKAAWAKVGVMSSDDQKAALSAASLMR